MILTNYNFLSGYHWAEIIFTKSWLYRRWNVSSIEGNKFEKNYLELINKLIIKNKITVIYVIGDLDDKINFII